ncbi:MAG: helix-turn-helix transcriptional regulator [Oscillospiraceae bacterium]|jgi:transcriptional regulator with XRE-family HTH domain|nr:helix-turn-helix transcriptional regulator [Oscillospiraceae bacterium]
MQKKSQEKSSFAVNLGKLRREKSLSQRRAAIELGISQALLSHYETDAREPKLDFVVKVSDYYGVTTDFILGRTNERGDGATRLSAQVNEVIDSLEDLKSTEMSLISWLRTLTKT